MKNLSTTEILIICITLLALVGGICATVAHIMENQPKEENNTVIHYYCWDRNHCIPHMEEKEEDGEQNEA